MFIKHIRNSVPVRRFLCGRQFLASRPLIELCIRDLLVLIVIPYVVGVRACACAFAVGHFCGPVFRSLVDNIDLRVFVQGVAQSRLFCYRHDIGEFLRIETGYRGSVHLDIRKRCRVFRLQDRVDGIYLIRYHGVIGLDGDDRRVVYAAGLNKDRLLVVRLSVLDGQRTAAVRHFHIKHTLVLVFQA